MERKKKVTCYIFIVLFLLFIAIVFNIKVNTNKLKAKTNKPIEKLKSECILLYYQLLCYYRSLSNQLVECVHITVSLYYRYPLSYIFFGLARNFEPSFQFLHSNMAFFLIWPSNLWSFSPQTVGHLFCTFRICKSVPLFVELSTCVY